MYGQFLAKQNKERTESLQQSTNIQNTWFAQNLTLLILDEVQLTTLQKMLYQVIQGLLRKKHQRHLQIVHPEQTQTVQDNVLTLLAEYDDVLREAIPLPIYILIWQITSLEKLAYTTEVVDDVLDVLEWYFTHQDETVAVFEEEDLDHEEIIDLYKAAIEEQDADAQFELGEYYSANEDTFFQPKKSIKWFELAAKQDNANAQYALGNYYFEGIGVEESYDRAFKLYEAAAQQGHADAAII